ncbi:MAG: potassium transporter TrkG [Waddliaceae bacterium]
MYYKDICKVLGYYLFGLSATLLIPFALAAYYEFFSDPAAHPQPHSTLAFFLTIIIAILYASVFYLIGRRSEGNLYRREGLVVVVLIWFLTPAIAGLPFFLSGTLEDYLHSYFEAASGFTTTGATVMQAKKYNPQTGREIPIRKEFCGARTIIYYYWGTITPVKDQETGATLYEGIEAVGKALLFWRSFTQWLGGMGIVVLFVAVLPALGVGGKVLFQAELPGPMKDSLTPRIKEAALQLWKIYLGLSLLEVFLLVITNREVTVFDALTITFSTLSTGGFTAKNNSIGHFNNIYTESIVMIFMIVASVNFSLYFFSLKGKFYRLYEPEFFLFLCIVVLICTFAAFFLVGTSKMSITGEYGSRFSLGEAIRYGAFQIVSALTTTGFATTNYEGWPYEIQVLMLIVMFIGGMSASTAGGMKVVRLYILFRIVQHKIELFFRPETVRRFKLGDREVDERASILVLCFFVLVVTIAAFATLFFVIDGMGPETSLSVTTLMMNNVGIGFRMAAPTESFAFLSSFGLIFSSLLMVFGRLEFLVVLATMIPAFWKQSR